MFAAIDLTGKTIWQSIETWKLGPADSGVHAPGPGLDRRRSSA
jgi:hypothetical protein